MDKDELDIMILFFLKLYAAAQYNNIKINFPNAILKEKYSSHKKE